MDVDVNVNHPTHYEGSTSIECIEAIELILSQDEFKGFLKGNVIKYLWRHKHKGGSEDLNKADWYINKYKNNFGSEAQIMSLSLLVKKYKERLK